MSRIAVVASVAALLILVQSISLGEDRETSVLRSSTNSQRVDRIGRLELNPNEAEGDAPYLLSGSWGNARVFVVPTDQVELDEYLSQRVAIRGRQQRTSDGRAVLIAEHITPLDAPRVRQAALQDIVPIPKGARPSPAASLPNEAVELPPGRIMVGPQTSTTPLILPPSDYIPFSESVIDDPIACPDCGRTHAPAVTVAPRSQRGCGTGCNSPEWAWIRGEYLLWFYDGFRTPPLVTTSPTGTPRAAAGVLGESGTTVLFGGDRVNGDDWVSGFRLRGGAWLERGKRFGVEGELFWLNEETTHFAATSNGNPILARPFFDIVNARETAELVAFPGVVRGSVAVDASTQIGSAALWARINACCADWSCQQCGQCQRSNDGYRLDWLLGYRYMRLDESLVISEDLTSLSTAAPGAFQIRDSFETENHFHGIEVGTVYELRRGRWMLELLSKLALGVNQQVVDINGVSVIDEAGDVQTYTGGILAQRTNIGRHVRDDFAVIPQLGATVGYQVTPRLRATAGYTFIYFSNVVRPGDHVDLDVNPNLFPPEAVPFTGPLRPRFAFDDTDFWAQGFSFGADFRF